MSLRHESNSSFPNHLSYENYLLFVSIILIEYSLLGYSLCSPSRNVKTKQFSLTKLKAAAVFLPGNSSSDETGSDTPRAPSKSREAILQLAARRQRRPLTSSLGSWERLQCRCLLSTKMCCTWSLEDSPEGATVFISLAEDSPRERVVPFKLRAELRLLEVIDGIWTCGVYGSAGRTKTTSYLSLISCFSNVCHSVRVFGAVFWHLAVLLILNLSRDGVHLLS